MRFERTALTLRAKGVSDFGDGLSRELDPHGSVVHAFPVVAVQHVESSLDTA
jgi:hypothetical protein